MEISEYVVLWFRYHPSLLKEDDFGKKSALCTVLESSLKHGVNIGHGLYGYKTREGWQDIFRVVRVLQETKIPHLLLPLDKCVYSGGDSISVEALKSLGLNPLSYPTD